MVESLYLIECEKASKNFGGLEALKDVSVYINRGEIVGLIGPNGAGKSTLFNCISGVYRPSSGVIKLEGENIVGLGMNQICRKGIGRTYQIVKPFPNMTVLGNVMVGALFGSKGTSLEDGKRTAESILRFTKLSDKKDALARTLTLADQRRLEIARALATEPKILLLDEVVAGLNATETAEAMQLIQSIRDKLKVTVFWVEHVMKAIMGIADRIIVLQYGKKIAEGPPKEIAKSEDVIAAYLGKRYF